MGTFVFTTKQPTPDFSGARDGTKPDRRTLHESHAPAPPLQGLVRQRSHPKGEQLRSPIFIRRASIAANLASTEGRHLRHLTLAGRWKRGGTLFIRRHAPERARSRALSDRNKSRALCLDFQPAVPND